MSLSKHDHFALIASLGHAEKVGFASRCAGLGLRVLTSVSFRVPFTDMAVLETVVRLTEESAAATAEPVELKTAMQELNHLAFASGVPSLFQSDVIVSHVARAIRAAGLTGLTGSAAHAQDTMDHAVQAARTAGTKEVEKSLDEELRRIRRIAADAGRAPLAPGR